jgi:DNA invertase Pin-like site-specific DNA recombinase
MSKITTEHLARSAYVYIRQSTADQLTHNHESRRRQYGLVDRARQLGWTAVEVIDDDLGRSGGGIARPGFERLLAAICEARVGAVLAIEVSRLARNGRDWHTLIEFCGLVGTIIVDEDGIYDPRHPNDRLLLGMKGTMSELELSLFRQRSQEALKHMARRGALVLGVAAGYVKVGRDRIEKNPDQRVCDALQLVFAKFAEFQSARQVHIWLRDEGIELPVKSRAGEARGVVWRLPAYNIVHNILTNPIYAGAYAFGRTTSKVSVVQGRKRVRRGVHRPMGEWDVLIKDHHEAYITWEEFERNQRVIANNATGKGSAKVKGAVRRGELLLPGLLRCGHCGRKLHVSYSGKLGRYNCYGARTNHGAARCISISGLSIDATVGTEVLRILKPLGTDAAVRAIETQTSATSAAQRQLELSLQQARFEAAHARRQYDAVDPANRLVAGELERRWNEALQAVNQIEGEIAAIIEAKPPPLGERERQDAAWRRSRTGLVASRRHGRYAQANLAHSAQRDRGARGRRGHPHGSALAGRRSHCTTGQAEIECCRPAPLAVAGGYDRARARVGAFDAGSTDRAPPQSFGQADGVWQRMDGAARARLSQTPRRRGLSGRRVG